jgi:hypothetical protein
MYYSQNTFLPPRYNITSTFWKHHYEITGSHNLYVENSQMTPGKPDLTFHTTNKEGPIIALSKYKHFSSDIEIGLSEGHSTSMRWDTLHHDGWRSSKYKLTAEINGRLEKYTWRPTHKMSLTRGGSLELVHDRTGAVAAVFSSHCGLKGSDRVLTFDNNACHGERFQLLVLMTCITLAEKTRRRNEAAAAGAASSASAGAAAAAA